MNRIDPDLPGGKNPRPRNLLARWRSDAAGATAMEFAMVAMPFMMLLFGIIGIGLYFFTIFTLEHAVEQASRLLRTGQAQVAGYTAAQFKAKVCEFVPTHIDCSGKVMINVKSYADTTNITAASLPTCLNAAGGLSTATQYSPGGASEVVLVWLCHEWELAKALPFLKFGNMPGGGMLIQATTVFRSEPYN